VDFVLNVCINAEHEIVSIAAGELEMVQQHLVRFQMQQVFKKISEHFDIVVCGNGGYPLDLNLYQAVKSMAIGEMAVKSGGTIISVNECIDGIGQDNFRELIFSRKTPKELYNQILNKVLIVPDQWEIQILTRILMKADIFVVSELGEKDLGNIGLKNAETVEEAIKIALKKHGKDARILILPSGPQVIPFLK
ncbi:MAG: nickel-dependent lactate racemase, partial [Promethearchaeota archaeon]